MNRSPSGLVGLLAAAALSTGCGLNHHVAEETGTRSIAVPGTPAVFVDTFNGSVEVTARAEGAVDVGWVKRGSSADSQAGAQADLAHVEVTAKAEGGAVRVAARRTDGRVAYASGVSFTLSVPRGCAVTVRAGNGAVRVHGLGAAVDARTSNGRIAVGDAKGALSLSTSNGSVEAAGLDAVLAVRSSNGSLKFSGTLAAGGHSATTSNGSIDVALPEGASFALDADTSNGKVTSEFPLASRTAEERSSLRGTVGTDPKATLTLKTSNGSIRVRRGS